MGSKGQMGSLNNNQSGDTPLVSVVTPTYNSAAFVAETLNSVMDQDYKNWEHIIVDDASTDDTFKIVQDHASKDPRVRPMQLAINSGAAVARNTAIKAARGRFIAFLDADDIWLPSKLATQIDYMLRTGASFTFSSYGVIDGQGAKIGVVDVPAKATYHSLLRSNVIGCLTAVYDSEKLGKIEMPSIRKRQDLGLWLRILKQVPIAKGLSEPLALYRVRPGSISHNKLDAAIYTWQLYRNFEKLPLLAAIYYFSCYAINGFIKTRRRLSPTEPA